MAVFDESQLPPGMPEELLHGVNGVVARLRGKLVKEIVLPEGQLGLRVPNLVRGYLQAHLRVNDHGIGTPYLHRIGTPFGDAR